MFPSIPLAPLFEKILISFFKLLSQNESKARIEIELPTNKFDFSGNKFKIMCAKEYSLILNYSKQSILYNFFSFEYHLN